MLGFLYALIAGAAMSIQGVMNTRLGDRIGVMEANAWVQGTGFLLAMAAALFFGKGSMTQFPGSPWYAYLGGVLAPVITITVMLSISGLSPTVAISTILLSQLTVAALIDAFGIMGAEKTPFAWPKIIGVVLMAGGVVLMKWKS